MISAAPFSEGSWIKCLFVLQQWVYLCLMALFGPPSKIHDLSCYRVFYGVSKGSIMSEGTTMSEGFTSKGFFNKSCCFLRSWNLVFLGPFPPCQCLLFALALVPYLCLIKYCSVFDCCLCFSLMLLNVSSFRRPMSDVFWGYVLRIQVTCHSRHVECLLIWEITSVMAMKYWLHEDGNVFIVSCLDTECR